METEHELDVVFLMWVPMGIDHMKSFIETYLRHYPKTPHSFSILFNGYGREANLEEYYAFLDQTKIPYKYILVENGQDLSAYRKAALQLTSEYVLFLNTYSRLLADHWLEHYLAAIKKDDIGLVGATGSWQSRSSYGIKRLRWIFSSRDNIEQNLPYYEDKKIAIAKFRFNIPPRLSLLGSFVKSLNNIFDFPLFPNPHLRTNAFVIRRNDWLQMAFNQISNKKDAYLLESGRKSFTRQMQSKGKKVVVIDRFGKIYEPHEWHTSKTFCSSAQENLIVSDNFTSQYQNLSVKKRVGLAKSIWGNQYNDAFPTFIDK